MDRKYHGFFRVGLKKMHVRDLASKATMHEWHNRRLSNRAAPSADPNAPQPKVLFECGRGLKNSVEQVLKNYAVTPAGKSTVVASEIVITVNSEYFGGVGIENWDPDKVSKWQEATMGMINKTFRGRVAMVIYHADESAPHIHAYVVPIVRHRSKHQWSVNGRASRLKHGQRKVAGRDYFTRWNLIKWQDAYGLAIEPLGLLRGERGSKIKHLEMRDAQRDIKKEAARQKDERNRLTELNSQTSQLNEDLKGEKQMMMQEQGNLQSESLNLKIQQDKMEEEKRLQARKTEMLLTEAERLKKLKADLELERQTIDNEKAEMQNERSRLRAIPIRSLAEKFGFTVDEQGVFSATLPHENVKGVEFSYRALMTEEKFTIEVLHYTGGGQFEWVKQGAGKGAIDFVRALRPKWKLPQVCHQLETLFPEQRGGVMLELMDRHSNSWGELIPAKQGPDKDVNSLKPSTPPKTEELPEIKTGD